MTNIVTVSDTVLDAMASNEMQNEALTGEAKGINEQRQALKMDSYCQLIAGIAHHKLTAKGHLPTTRSKGVQEMLTNYVGLTDSMAEKMHKNAVGARRELEIGGNNVTPEMVADVFAGAGITSEAKLIKLVGGQKKQTKIQKLVQQIVGKPSKTGKAYIGGLVKTNADGKKTNEFDEAQLEEFKNALEDALRVRREAEAAAQEAADKAQAENDAVNEMTAQLEGQAA